MKYFCCFCCSCSLQFALQIASSSHRFLSQEGCNVDSVRVSSKAFVDSCISGFLRYNLSSACRNDNLVSDSLFNGQLVDALHVLVVNIVVGNDSGRQDRICVQFYSRIYQLFNRYGGSKVFYLDAPLFDSAMLDVDDFPQTSCYNPSISTAMLKY